MNERPALVQINTDDVIGEVSPLLFGGFAEHLGRCIYGGIYDPDAELSDARGFRTDVLAALREMKLTILRYPGGNFVSGYNWRDGVGPREHRPRRRELAWQSIETNQFGTNEFVEFCRELKAEPMMAVNLGTGSLNEVSALVEYCNAPMGTEFADLRMMHGFPKPHEIKYWCLGNEMDGPWQIGALSAEDYAKKAREAAKIMKWHDPRIKTILCGSSGPFMRTFPEWDRTALTHCWEQTDYLSLHNYATNWENDTPSFLAYANQLEGQLTQLRTVLAEVKQKLKSKHDVQLCWDEWNVWYKDRNGNGQWQEAPHLCEEVYNLEDALVVAQWLNVLLRNCDVVTIACIAQIVNVISPLLTTREKVLKQSTFFPFVMYANHCAGRSLRARVKAPVYETKRFGEAPVLDVAVTQDPTSGGGAVFLVHRQMDQSLEVEIAWEGKAPTRVTEAQQMWGMNPKAANSFDRPDVVVPKAMGVPVVKDGRVRVKLPPLSFTMLVTS
ncbi:MAG TPA: alpha-L-arabinofuranosidase C-terminal domain-containing protein [Tepidisphaeraceae bacterium]